jgi:hypothetical protein
MTWTGSRAEVMESCVSLLEELEVYPDPAVVAFIAEVKVRLARAIRDEQAVEYPSDRDRDERFE